MKRFGKSERETTTNRLLTVGEKKEEDERNRVIVPYSISLSLQQCMRACVCVVAAICQAGAPG